MDRIEPNALKGPKAYYTGFDRRIVTRQKNELASLRKKSERSLKLLLLFKSHIVCAASHLTTEFAFELFKENPVLLTNSCIIPAFRTDLEEIEQLFTKTRFKEKSNAISFFKEHINKTVNWDLEDNSK